MREAVEGKEEEVEEVDTKREISKVDVGGCEGKSYKARKGFKFSIKFNRSALRIKLK